MKIVNTDATNLESAKINITPDGRVRRKDAATYLALSERTLANWHSRRIGPRSYRVGGRAFYYVADLEAFVTNQVVR